MFFRFYIVTMYGFFYYYAKGEINLPLLVIGGAALQGSMPLSLTWAQDLMPNNAAMASGLLLGLTYGIGGIGTALTVFLADQFGLLTPLKLTMFLLVPALALTCLIQETVRKAPGALNRQKTIS